MYSASLFNSLGGVFHRFSWFEFFHLFSLFWKLLTYTWTYVSLCILFTYFKILSLVLAFLNFVHMHVHTFLQVAPAPPHDIEKFFVCLAIHDMTGIWIWVRPASAPPSPLFKTYKNFQVFFAIHDLTLGFKILLTYWLAFGNIFFFNLIWVWNFWGHISPWQWGIKEKGLSAWNTIAFTIVTLLNYYGHFFEFELA